MTRCMQRYWTYYTYGSSTWAQDACTYDAIYNEAKTNNFTLKSVLMAIVHAAELHHPRSGSSKETTRHAYPQTVRW